MLRVRRTDIVDTIQGKASGRGRGTVSTTYNGLEEQLWSGVVEFEEGGEENVWRSGVD